MLPLLLEYRIFRGGRYALAIVVVLLVVRDAGVHRQG